MKLLKKISRSLILGLLVSGIISLLVSCIGYTTDWDPSWTNRYEHEKRHMRAFWQDMAEVHRFIDRHLFNFDEEDPDRY